MSSRVFFNRHRGKGTARLGPSSVAVLICALGAIVGIASPVIAQPVIPGDVAPTTPQAESTAAAPAIPLAEALTRRGDLTLRNSSLNAALLTISELWGINVVAGDVPGSVNGVFKNAPLQEILDSILISNGYGYRAVGESLVVSDLAKLGQVNPFFESATIPVLSADVNDVVSGAQLLTTPQGQIRAVPSASSIFVLDFPDRVKMIREFAASADAAAQRSLRSQGGAPIGAGPQQLQVAYLHTHYIDALSAVPLLQTVLSDSGRVAALEDEDRLLVVDFAENLQVVATVLQRIDRPRPQVSVQALIYDIGLQDMEEIGLNWQSATGGNGATSLTADGLATDTITGGGGALISSVTRPPPGENAVGNTFTFFTLNSDLNLSAVASALQQAADSRLLASPNVTVVDNDEATIESVSEIPFQQLTQTAAGGNIGTTAFRDAGITLQVQPKIARDGTIEMLVRPEFSLLTGFTPGDNQPIIDRRTAETRVRIANGQTFVIAGLRQRSDIGDFAGVPILKDVRFFGRLFRSRETEVRESELVVFISPAIVGYDDPLNQRDQATADTVRCRLQQIPPPEGCPGGGHCASCQSNFTPIVTAPITEPVTTTSEPATDITPIQESTPALPTPLPPSEPIPPGTAGAAKSSSELAYPELASHRPRRLPPTEESYVASSDAKTSGSPAATEGRTRVAHRNRRLRPDYQSRYRATGGVYPSRQRAADPANSDQLEDGSDRSLLDRVLLR